jgi:hypothetical protein
MFIVTVFDSLLLLVNTNVMNFGIDNYGTSNWTETTGTFSREVVRIQTSDIVACI